MRSDEETYHGARQARTDGGELHSLRPGRSWPASPPLFEWLQRPLGEQVSTQRITLASPDPWGLRRAMLTAAG